MEEEFPCMNNNSRERKKEKRREPVLPQAK